MAKTKSAARLPRLSLRSGEETRLVNAYRACSDHLREQLLAFASFLVIDRDAVVAARRLERALVSYASDTSEQFWKCDAPEIVKGMR